MNQFRKIEPAQAWTFYLLYISNILFHLLLSYNIQLFYFISFFLIDN